MILIFIVGVILLVTGLLDVFSKRFFEWSNDLIVGRIDDGKVLSKRERYFVRRYFGGFQGIFAGIAAIALYVFTNDKLLSAIVSWAHAFR